MVLFVLKYFLNMAIFDFLRRKPQAEAINMSKEERSLAVALGYNSISSFANSQTMRLSAVYAATNMISNSCALLPMKIVTEEGGRKRKIQHPLYKVLNLKPSLQFYEVAY